MRRAPWLTALVMVAGCGGSTAMLDGKVSFQGRTVTSGSVIVVNEDGTAESGVIQPDGSYSIGNVKRGHVKIGVRSPDPAHARSILKPRERPARGVAKASAKSADGGWFPLPPQTGNPANSGIECDVTESRVHFDIEIR